MHINISYILFTTFSSNRSAFTDMPSAITFCLGLLECIKPLIDVID